jgi:hypothetical protein
LEVPKKSTKPLIHLGFQEPKSNKLNKLSPPNPKENSNRSNRCKGKNTQSAEVLLSQMPPKQLMIWGKMRGRTKEENTKFIQDLDPMNYITKRKD